MKKLTQHNVAGQIGISQQDYSKWENTEVVTEEFLERFLQGMQCSKEELQQIQKLHYQQ
ncbi:MAG: helix-turn-helix transcriptional regulator [Chitinophagaceae bacterium]|nr:helix-turn-helix transcriptional regulator [Chitinophagaceae bacterium]